MRRALLLLTAFFALCGNASAQDLVTETLRVPTVDGAEIAVEVTRPAAGRVPVILTYSPYNAIRDGLGDAYARYLGHGYARAFADVLGTNDSSGCWDYGGPKEQQSGVDLVNFLAAQPWSNGRVAMVGGSYDGTTANMVAARSQDAPGLAAIVPGAAISRWYGYAYQAGVRYLGNGQNPDEQGFDTPLAFEFGFGKTPTADIQAMQDRLKPCNAAEHMAHGYDTSPDYDDFWRARDYRRDASAFRVPVLLNHGWQDFNVKQEEAVGLYPLLDRVPWKGMWLGQYSHGSPGDDEWWRLVDQFLATFLKREQAGLPRGGVVVSETRDAFADADPERLSAWPPARTADVELPLGRGTLGPSGGDPASYVDTGVTEELVAEDPFAEAAWVTYAGEPAAEDARIAGSPVLDATIVADRDHGHLAPVLFDVAEDGTAVPITRGFLNLRYRDGLEAGKPVPVGEPVRVVVQLLPQDWIVRRGHRLVLVIASSNTAWAVPDQPGLGVEVRHGGASRLLVPIAGAARALPDHPAIPAGQRPAELLPTSATARKRLRVTLRRGKGRSLRVTGRAPSRTSVFLRLMRGRAVVRDRSVRVRRGRFSLTIRVRKPGTYRVTALLRTREGVVSRRSGRVRLR